MNTIYIMSSIHLTVKENVVINNPEPISQPDQGNDEIEVREIDESNQEEVQREIRRLIEVRMKYNIHNPPKPDHIKWEDYGFEKKAEYKAAKDKHYKDYKTKCETIEKNISNLNSTNTALCFENRKKEDEIKIKNGTFFNSDEKEYLRLKEELRKESRKLTNSKYYEKNKTKILKKQEIKIIKKRLDEAKKQEEVKSQHLDHLIKSTFTIKPLCQCGRLCDVTKFKTLVTHSNIEKHQLFKSIIALIHYKRRNGAKLKTIIDKLNSDYVDYKRVVREKRNGKSVTITNKTDKEVIQLYGDYLNPMDENETHQPRKSYIEKVKYTQYYKDIVLIKRWKVNQRTEKANNKLTN